MDEKVYRSFKGKSSAVEGFLEDYAFLIQAYIALYQSTFNETWIVQAEKWMNYTQTYFYDAEEGYFHFTSNNAEKLIARKKEIFDNVIPSSNGVMARNLYHLGTLLDKPTYQTQASKMLASISNLVIGEPAYMSHWGILYAEMILPMAEIAVVGPEAKSVAAELRRKYLPFSFLMGTESGSNLPLLAEKVNPEGKPATIYVCFNKTCKLPVHDVQEALEQIPIKQKP